MEKSEMEEIKRHFGVVAEGLRSEIRQVAEGHDAIREEIKRFREEVREEFKEVTVRCVKQATVPPGPHSPGESPRRGGGPPLSVGSVGRAKPLPGSCARARAFPANEAARGMV